MVHQFTDSGAVGLIAIDLFATKVAEVLPKTSIRTVVVVTIADLLPPLKRAARPRGAEVRQEDDPADHLRAHDRSRARWREGADRIAAGADPRVYAEALTHDSVAALQYTGGTTGVAKGAVLTHGNLLANTIQGLEMWKPFLRVGAGGDADGAAAVPHLRVHREPDDLLRRRRTQHPHPESAAALEPEDGDGDRADHLVHRRQHACSPA